LLELLFCHRRCLTSGEFVVFLLIIIIFFFRRYWLLICGIFEHVASFQGQLFLRSWCRTFGTCIVLLRCSLTGRGSTDLALECFLLLGKSLFLSHLLLFGATFCDIGLKILHVDLAVVVVGLVLIYIVSIDSRKLFKDISLVLSSHLLLVASFFHFLVNLILDIIFHLFWHFFVVFQFAHSVHVILFLIELEWVKTLLFVLLVIDLGGRLFLSNLLFSLLEFVVYRLQHCFLFVGSSSLLLFWVDCEEFVWDLKQFSEVGVFYFQLLDEEIVLDQSGVIDLTVVLQKRDLKLFGLFLMEFAIDLQFFGVFQIPLGLELILLQPDDFKLLPFVFSYLRFEF
jgi:hypothetical protein